MAATSSSFVITIDRTQRQILDLLTRRKAFALVSLKKELREQVKNFSNREERFYLLESCDDLASTDDHDLYLFIGKTIRSRTDAGRKNIVFEQLKDLNLSEDALSFPNMQELLESCGEKHVSTTIKSASEKDANQAWLRECLGFRLPEPQKYFSEDLSKQEIRLRKVADSENSTVKSKVEAHFEDAKNFEVYSKIFDHMALIAAGKVPGTSLLNDDIFVEYTLSDGASGKFLARYMALEFYSNHAWKIDPLNLLNLRFTAKILSDPCTVEDVRFSHPSKATRDVRSNDQYLIDSIKVVNSMSGKKQKEDAQAEFLWDDPEEFEVWICGYREKIRFA